MGPLADLKIIEFAGIGPAPMCGMLLADQGANVLRIERPQGGSSPPDHRRGANVLQRGKICLVLDLKVPESVEKVLSLVAHADALIEGFRPGVTERLGLSPAVCHARNKALVYGRMTGWGQTGPLAQSAGHDLNYIALTGALHAIGRVNQAPTPPLNLVGDFGGGALYLAFGLLAAILEARRSGHGQVIDAAMVDGVTSLMTTYYGGLTAGQINVERGTNLLDSGAPFYDVYECADGKFVAVAAIEPEFFAILLRELGLDAAQLPAQMDRTGWPLLRKTLAERFASLTRDAWADRLATVDACVVPVLSPLEAPLHPHLRDRKCFIEAKGGIQAAPAPRFSRSSGAREHHSNDTAMAAWGLT